MLIDLVLVWRFFRAHGTAALPRRLHRYSLAAYLLVDHRLHRRAHRRIPASEVRA